MISANTWPPSRTCRNSPDSTSVFARKRKLTRQRWCGGYDGLTFRKIIMGSLKLEQQANRVNRWNSPSSSVLSPLCLTKNMTNESMDSGIAGVRGSPASSTILPPGSSKTPAQRPVTVDKQLVAQYIVDTASRTTYLKGRFLGKVISIQLSYHRFNSPALIAHQSANRPINQSFQRKSLILYMSRRHS